MRVARVGGANQSANDHASASSRGTSISDPLGLTSVRGEQRQHVRRARWALHQDGIDHVEGRAVEALFAQPQYGVAVSTRYAAPRSPGSGSMSLQTSQGPMVRALLKFHCAAQRR
jgi:hypothetical protein